MEENTSYEEVIDSFHSTFQDKVELPGLLEKEWFKKAVGKFSFEIDSINYDEDLEEFDTKQEAMSKEAKIKRLTRKEKLLLIENYQQEQKLNLEH